MSHYLRINFNRRFTTYKVQKVPQSVSYSILNVGDFRYWFCECHYTAPYGLVISADCEKHDRGITL